jgi:integrase/recombinase XerC
VTPTLDAYLAPKPLNTARTYRRAVTSWLDWLGKEPARATPRDARQWAATLAACYRPVTARTKLSACTSFHGWLVENGLARANPFDGITRPRVQRHAASRVLCVAEVRRLNGYLDGARKVNDDDAPPSHLRDRALIGFLLATGRWPSEIESLRWDDLNTQAGQPMLRWAGGVQAIPERIRADLLAWHEAEGWLILPAYYIWRRRQAYNNLPNIGPLDPDGHITAKQIAAIVRRVGRLAGIPDLSPGALRNTYAALHLTTTGDLAGTARALGHASTETLARLVDSPRGAAAMREFGAVLEALR